MGQTGSYTSKVTVATELVNFTKWDETQLKEVILRSQSILADTFALRLQEFIFMVGKKTLSLPAARSLYNRIFDTDHNSLVDKFEVIAALILLSSIPSEEKVCYIYDTFDFNNKGYLVFNEMILLLRTVTTVAGKIDVSLLPPSSDILHELSALSMRYAVLNKNSLRKYELVEFARSTPVVRAFLECWRGHASQVLLAGFQLWQDPEFSALHNSIAPSSAWLSIGLPPANFVKWKRRHRINNGCKTLFGHTERISKISEKLCVEGLGCMGTGHLKQGLLADRFILNAVATCIANPAIIHHLFAVTGQEDVGRFCVRLFEGRGWQSVFFDDRIPCTPDYKPLFMQSSCDYEAWPFLLEKAIAKILGSYGQLAACGVRHDATEYMLRYFTGGHVFKLQVANYDWRSVAAEVVGEDGANFIMRIINEGSLLSLGRSEPILYHYKGKKTHKRTQYMEVPHGRLFPVLRMEMRKGYKYLILRDAWGLIPNALNDVDSKSGHCRTFEVVVEDLPHIFDTIYTARFPDCRRAAVFRDAARGHPSATNPWFTEILCEESCSKNSPARFLITVPSLGDDKADNKPVEVVFTLTRYIDLHYFSDYTSTIPWSKCNTNPKAKEASHIWGSFSATRATRAALCNASRFIRDPLNTTVVAAAAAEKRRWNLEQVCGTSAKSVEVLAGVSNERKDSTSARDDTARGEDLAEESVQGTDSIGVRDDSYVSVAPSVKHTSEKEQHATPTYEHSFMAERCWMSNSFTLYPGSYVLQGYIEETVSTGAPKSTIDPEVSESARKQLRRMLSHNVNEDASLTSETVAGVWAQVTSTRRIKLQSLCEPKCPVSEEEVAELPLLDDICPQTFIPEKYPFMVEHQHEVGSKGLYDLISRLRIETDVLNAKVLELEYFQDL